VLSQQRHTTRNQNMRMPRVSFHKLSPPRDKGATLPIDHTRWMAVVIEIVAIAGAAALAYLHTAA
jgi:hypothetical protein